MTPKKRKPIPAKTVHLLQKEINSKCPFCSNEDVDHFETHHIDENPENNEIKNLLRLCPTCHSKITKGDITRERVIETKYSIIEQKIEIYKIDIDADKCSWLPYPNVINAFHLTPHESKSPFPIFQLGIINHYDKTIILKGIELKINHLYSGLSGIPDTVPGPVPKMAVKKIIVKGANETHFVENFEDIEIPAQKSILYQIELLHKAMGGSGYWVSNTRKILFFTLKFSNNTFINLPKILLNTENENEGVTLQLLG